MVMDKQLLQKIRDIASFSEEERTKIYDLIDMAISYHKTKKGLCFLKMIGKEVPQK